MKKNVITSFLLVISCCCFSQTMEDTIARIEKAMSRYLPQNPGCQLSIQRNGKTIFSNAYGMADLEHNVPMALNSRIEAGSVSKQFTAAAILLLEQQGKLSVSDDIRKYVPEIPSYGHIITIAHLLHHTSGLKDWSAIAGLTGEGRYFKNYTNDDALRIVSAQKTLNNIPGDEHIYSNSNYNLMAIIVSRVSGQSLAEFTQQHIFLPAGMNNTEWRDNYKRVVVNRAVAYRPAGDGYEMEMPNEDSYGNGGLITTTEDLLKWSNFYQSGRFGNPSLFREQTRLVPLNNGKANDYASGLVITTYKGHRLITHNGATAGYRSFLETFPDLKLTVAYLSNTSEFDSKPPLDNAIRDIFVKDRSEAVKADKIYPGQPSRSLLSSYSGWYKSERSGAGLRVELKGNALYIGETELNAESQDMFRLGKSKAKLKFDPAKKRLDIITETGTNPFNKAEAPEVDETYLSRYTGKYFSDETNSFMRITLKDGALVISPKPGSDMALTPTYGDGFDISRFGGNLHFITDDKGTPTGMKISISRARNIEFKKVE